jgi:hypothetical protein
MVIVGANTVGGAKHDTKHEDQEARGTPHEMDRKTDRLTTLSLARRQRLTPSLLYLPVPVGYR